ncbi:OLC1v1004253C1 [Oldenlandia corymbosa var. corymbosa]|uniref:OLC1v1004253C1 n=1 Tax=Oldenlandia corymbosa var. corymbosa TaxID=529605 RepID=A0AAV1DEW1_OLDCO|nr:OLC1v1004253C1 [Oldenlandia corymbosa var. corymbosa]
MSNLSAGDDGSFSSGDEVHQDKQPPQPQPSNSAAGHNNTNGQPGSQPQQQQQGKKKRNLPGTPDPTAEVVALSPTTLMATNRFVCEICNKGFQRDQNLQLHRRGHNLPWKLRQRTTTEVRKRVYICPEPTCVHHNPARALGDLTGIKKHYSRKHGEKKWKCDKCSKKYAVQSDWKAHQKTCGTREYKCDCGTIFSRRDSFITHRAFCDALAEENNKVNQGLMSSGGQLPDFMSNALPNASMGLSDFNNFDPKNPLKSLPHDLVPFKPMNIVGGGMFSSTTSGTLFGSPKGMPSTSSSGLQLSSSNGGGASTFNSYLQSDGKNGSGPLSLSGSPHMSATALLQRAAQLGATATNNSISSPMMQKTFVTGMAGPDHNQISPPKTTPTTTYNNNNNNSYENFPTTVQQPLEQSNLVGLNNHHHHQQFFSAGTANNSAMNDMAMYGGMLMSSGTNDQNPATVGFMRNLQERHDHQVDTAGTMGRTGGGGAAAAVGMRGGNAGNDVLTVDFLGIGGASRPPPNYNIHQQPGMHIMDPFHGEQAAAEKPLWEV